MPHKRISLESENYNAAHAETFQNYNAAQADLLKPSKTYNAAQAELLKPALDFQTLFAVSFFRFCFS